MPPLKKQVGLVDPRFAIVYHYMTIHLNTHIHTFFFCNRHNKATVILTKSTEYDIIQVCKGYCCALARHDIKQVML